MSLQSMLAGLVDERLVGAACTGRAPLFDSHVEGETCEQKFNRQERAKVICAKCPVRTACRSSVMEERRDRRTGIWAGVDQEEGTKHVSDAQTGDRPRAA